MSANDDKKKGTTSGNDSTIASPYTLHPSDNPGMIISPVQLRGENYDEWARSMRNALRAKKKLGFIDGTVTRPSDDSSEIEDWWMVNSMLVAWVFNTIEPSLRSTITYMENVKDLWEDLRQRFSIGNRPRVQQLKADIANCKQAGQAVVSYYGRLKMMWDELVSYEPIPVCQCSGCKCNITAELMKKQENERIHQFLMGLDDAVFGTVRSNTKFDASVFYDYSRRTTPVEERDKRPKSSSKSSGIQICGEIDPEEEEKVLDAVENELNKVDRSAFPRLTNEQWVALLNLLNTHKIGASKKLTGKTYCHDWILDAGASQHMTGDIKLLTGVRKISPCLVGLPIGEHTTAMKEGIICFGKHIYLNNVLFVPDMNCTLISVAQMVKELNCIVTFSDKLCVIQDRTSRTLIGADGSNYVDELNEYRCLSRDGDIMLDRGRMEDTTHEVETDKVSEAGICNEANCENMSDTVDPPTMPIVEQETLGRGFWSKQPPAKFKEYVIYTARRLKDPTALATA
ncbi:hypothetical protein Salat_2557000 [Sesamum alatum]|uniref:Retrotransposon Copia-like N-terminal domain-containing protein n=1 Tax=Sesamum alatum TaxID=300844 RepID=A0AAE1XTK4_9LAMI|nr:hypothetical protein Salat_2557000 [Sesamum alatum]